MAEIGTLFSQGDPGDHFSGRSFSDHFEPFFFRAPSARGDHFGGRSFRRSFQTGKFFKTPATIIWRSFCFWAFILVKPHFTL